MEKNSSDDFRCRNYRREDYDQVVSLWLVCKLIKRKESTPHKMLNKKSLMDKSLFVVCTDIRGRIVGTVMGGWDGWRGWIYKLAVDPDLRRRGLGGMLIHEISRRLRRRGAGIVRAYVEKDNLASLSLFKKVGFETVDFVIVTDGRQ